MTEKSTLAGCNGFADSKPPSPLKGAVRIFLVSVVRVRLYRFGVSGSAFVCIGPDSMARGRRREATGRSCN